MTSSTNDDGTVSHVYHGRAVETTNVNGIQKITQYDMLGRVSSICEISSSTLMGSDLESPVACAMDIGGSGFLTSYAYTGLTTTITQGSQQRAFTTDPAGRTTSVTEPERGQTTYSYAYNSTGLVVTRSRPQANQTSTSVLTTTTTQYDSLGRPVTISYSDGITPNMGYVYDAACCWTNASSATNTKGKLVVAHSLASAADHTSMMFSYDLMGNVINMWQCAPSTCPTSTLQLSRPALSFAYDLTGNLISEGDGASGVIAYGRSPAGEVTSITNQSYTNAPYNPPNLVSNVVNGPFGPITYSLGNGLGVVNQYDGLGRVNQNRVCSGSIQPNCSGGAQVYGFGTGTVGSQIVASCDSVLGQCYNYGYDQFNRLASGTVYYGPAQNFTYSYDRYGNRWQQNVTAGTGPAPSFSFNVTNNRINGPPYDAAGNMMSDGIHSYTYDANGNILSVDSGSTAQYVYDALNRRVSVQTASSSNEYLFDYAGRRTSTWQVSNNSGIAGRIYWGGQQIAYRAEDGTTYFEHQDWLGTERMRTNYAGSVSSSYVSLPWGDGYTPNENNAAGNAQDNLHFAQLDHDTESLTDHAQFRQYSSAQGRWLSPDPYDGSYDVTNPQSFNRYGYGLNNPLAFVDPLGLDTLICNTYTYSTDSPDSPTGGAPDAPPDPQARGASSNGVHPNDAGTQTECFTLFSGPNLPNFPTIKLPPFPTTTRTYAPNNQILPCLVKGAVVGAVGAVAVGALAVGAVAVGAPVAAVTGVLGVLAVAGGAALGYNTIGQISSGNWAGVAYNAGSVAGGAAVGGAGGRFIAQGINGAASPAWSWASDLAQRYNPSLGSIGNWLGTGPNPGSAGGSAAAAGAGAATVAKKGC
jgi:RHS repeat-associated protein